jgi:hypothetical protein
MSLHPKWLLLASVAIAILGSLYFARLFARRDHFSGANAANEFLNDADAIRTHKLANRHYEPVTNHLQLPRARPVPDGHGRRVNMYHARG